MNSLLLNSFMWRMVVYWNFWNVHNLRNNIIHGHTWIFFFFEIRYEGRVCNSMMLRAWVGLLLGLGISCAGSNVDRGGFSILKVMMLLCNKRNWRYKSNRNLMEICLMPRIRMIGYKDRLWLRIWFSSPPLWPILLLWKLRRRILKWPILPSRMFHCWGGWYGG